MAGLALRRFMSCGILVYFICLAPATSTAMTFEIDKMRGGFTVLRAAGPIMPGTSDRFEEALSRMPVGKDGMRPVIFSSPGGDVAEALDMAEIINKYNVMTVVGWNDICSSACASVLFLAGDARVVVGNGLLQFHPCASDAASGVDDVCNELLPEEMMGEGVAFGDLASLLRFYRTVDQFITLDQEMAHCGGLSRWPHERGERIAFSRCAQAVILGAIVDEDHPGGPRDYPVPRGMSPVQFAYDWRPRDRWELTHVMDGLRAYRRENDAAGDDIEVSYSCSLDAPGDAYVSYIIRGNLIRQSIEFMEISLDGNSVRIPYGQNMAIYRESDATEVVVLLPQSRLALGDPALSNMEITLIGRNGRTLYRHDVSLQRSSDAIAAAMSNCTVQFVPV